MAMKKFDDWKNKKVDESNLTGTEKLAKLRAGATAFRRGQAALSTLADEGNERKMAKEIVGFIEPTLKTVIAEKMQEKPNLGKATASNLARFLRDEIRLKIAEILKTPLD